MAKVKATKTSTNLIANVSANDSDKWLDVWHVNPKDAIVRHLTHALTNGSEGDAGKVKAATDGMMAVKKRYAKYIPIASNLAADLLANWSDIMAKTKGVTRGGNGQDASATPEQVAAWVGRMLMKDNYTGVEVYENMADQFADPSKAKTVKADELAELKRQNEELQKQLNAFLMATPIPEREAVPVPATPLDQKVVEALQRKLATR